MRGWVRRRLPDVSIYSEHESPLAPLEVGVWVGFAEQLGYRRDRRYVAPYWEPAGDELVLRDDTILLSVADRYPYLALVGQPAARACLWEQEITLGNSDGPATRWLIAVATT
jgi:hypothetical protein